MEKERGEKKANRTAPQGNLRGYVITAAIVTAVVIAAVAFARGWQYKEYRILRSERQEDTITSFYKNVGGNILQYGVDEVRLQDRQGQDVWSFGYSERNPQLVTCGNTLALYDKGGTEIVTANRTGKIGAFTTRLPVIRASVSSQGNVAVISEDDTNAWVDYYTAGGTEIASVKTSMDNPGYPLGLGVSPDGKLLAVSYLSFTDGIQKGVVHIYDFSAGGQNQMDNRIASFEYSQRIVPEVSFLDNKTFIVYRDNGFTVYEGAKVPKAVREVTVDREISSVFGNENYIGLILPGDGSDTCRLCLYSRSGRELINEEVDFPYARVELYGDEISLYSGSALRVYNLDGRQKFDGAYEGDPRSFFAIGKRRYVVVTDTVLDVIQLR